MSSGLLSFAWLVLFWLFCLVGFLIFCSLRYWDSNPRPWSCETSSIWLSYLHRPCLYSILVYSHWDVSSRQALGIFYSLFSVLEQFLGILHPLIIWKMNKMHVTSVSLVQLPLSEQLDSSQSGWCRSSASCAKVWQIWMMDDMWGGVDVPAPKWNSVEFCDMYMDPLARNCYAAASCLFS